MTSKWTLVLIVLMAIVLHAYKAYQTSGISGRISDRGAETVWAIHGGDSIKAIPANGVFKLQAKPGIYRLVVDARQPYRNTLVESIEVTSGNTTDLGEIKLTQ